MVVRPLQWADFQEWADLFYSRWDELQVNPDLGLSIFPTKPSLAEEAMHFGKEMGEVLKGDRVSLVVEVEGKVVGTGTVNRKSPTVESRHVGVIGVHVLRGWRGKGHGRQLMDELLRASSGKFEIVQLTAYASNDLAIRLYQKCGFQEFGRAPRAHKRGDRYIDEVRMWRPVD